ncbi:MAG TPA: DNA-formamidopyrimidine glycosylase [Candidatus Limnocylindria bacterium]|nr:DNA-formamidopyrimidine glycosylase [Candidatus Limnocylindria bacterium]
MPELPEVEAVARALRPLVEGKKIIRCRVIHPIVVHRSSQQSRKQAAAQLEKKLRGMRICGVERRGKYLILALERGAVVLHFRFDGQLIWFDSRETSGHVDVAFETRGGTLGFVDPRHLGRVQWVAQPEEIPGIRALGVDALSKEFTSARFGQLLALSRNPLKICLLDQTNIAGIGNIYSSEALWCARIDPRRPSHRLSTVEVRRLHKAIVGILQRALECCLNPAPNFRDPRWWFQGLERILRVYGREGKCCRRCRKPVQRIEQGGRSTYFCARCQR